MATFGDWSTTPSSNVTIGSVNIAEGAPPANINDAIRELMAAAKTFDNSKADGSLYVTKASSVLSANVTISGRGGALHNSNPSNSSGRVFVQALGGATPSMSNGDWLAEF